ESFLTELETGQTPAYQSAWLGSRSLGFIAKDAACIAHAWASQSLRLQSFDASLWPCHAPDFGMSLAEDIPSFAPCPPKLGLYAVVPDAQWVDKVVQLGVPTVQLRFKSDDSRAISQQIAQSVKAVAGTPSLLFINDHWQKAMDAGAYGVHLGQEDMQDAPLQALRLAGLRLGLSSHGYSEMLAAYAWRPSYMALGAVFPTTLKKMQTVPQGLGRLTQYVRLMQHTPLVAIGGIDLHSLPAVMQSGVGSAAVVRAITGAEDTAQAVHALMKCMA
ncbi:MAG: thiamine phosphate synthase, partial [Betaproteobacteria bacterium]|nr:thiamine phosphate synthase [Betaproteobacteria bacterium]